MLKAVLLEPEFDLPFRGLLNEGRTYLVSPLWALSIGTFLKINMPDTALTILDCRIFPESKLAKWAKKNRPDIVGISPKFLTYGSTLRAARIFKKFGAKIILGGMHATALKNEILKNRGLGSDDYCIDAIVKEDGEKAFCEYASGKSLPKINNLVWRESGGIRENKTEILDLNSLPIADRDLVDVQKYLNRVNMFTVLSQKGCIWREKSGGCIFCAQGLSGLRFRNPSDVWEEIDFLKRKYNIKIIWDSSENFLNDLNWVKEFWKISKNYGNRPQFKIFSRLDSIDRTSARILKGIGIYEIILGIESGAQQSLSAFRKGITTRMTKKKIRLLHEYGIRTFHCFVLGAPRETEKTIDETLKFAKELSKMPGTLGMRFNTLVAFPGSPAWTMLLKETGGKYFGKDLMDWKEVIRDWLVHFCNVDLKVFNQKLKEAREISGIKKV